MRDFAAIGCTSSNDRFTLFRVDYPSNMTKDGTTWYAKRMLIAWIERIENSKHTRRLAAVAFILLIVAVVLDGRFGIVLQALVLVVSFFGSACVGVVIGGFLARQLNNQILKRSTEFGKRLAAGFSVFGFLFLPALVGFWANLYLNAGIVMYSLEASILLALLGGGLSVMFRSSTSDD
ncbi:hypothetical protein [Tateyamaria sp.]|uniref:hypothetical protein n=1 Tax=Tateyamaria sp. TaxID=1929288 RepID=UPI00329F7F02